MSDAKAGKNQKTGFWKRAALRMGIVAAGLGAGHTASAQENTSLEQQSANIELSSQTDRSQEMSREDIAEFRLSVQENKQEYQAELKDMAEEVVADVQDLKDMYGKPRRKDYDSRAEYKDDLKEWKKEHHKPSKKDFANSEDYDKAMADWQSNREERIVDKMDALAMIQGMEAYEQTGKLAVATGEMAADAMETNLKYSERASELAPGTKEYKDLKKQWEKDLRKSSSLKEAEAEARAMKGKTGSAQALQKLGRCLHNEKALDAALDKGMNRSKKIINQADKNDRKLAAAAKIKASRIR